MESKERLLVFLKHLQIGQNKFEKQVGLANGSINNSKGDVSGRAIQKIHKVYPLLNILWLITGEGEMLNLTKNKSTVKEITEENRYNSSDYISLQKDLISAQAKIITLNEELQELRQELLIYLKNKPSKNSTGNDDVFFRSARKTGV